MQGQHKHQHTAAAVPRESPGTGTQAITICTGGRGWVCLLPVETSTPAAPSPTAYLTSGPGGSWLNAAARKFPHTLLSTRCSQPRPSSGPESTPAGSPLPALMRQAQLPCPLGPRWTASTARLMLQGQRRPTGAARTQELS